MSLVVYRVVLLFAALVLLATSTAPVQAQTANASIPGPKPTYTDRALSVPPNDAAIVRRAWAPGIDEGYVPQGVTVTRDAVYLSSYLEGSGARKCRVYRIDPATALETAHFDLPKDCGHAGGLANDGAGRLFVVDTWRLYEIDLSRAFLAGADDAAVVRSLSLRFPVRGSFVTYRDGALWIGEYKKPKGGTLRVVPLAAVAAAREPAGLGPDAVAREFALSPAAQGAAFAPDGTLWISRSSSQFGSLQRVDPKTGAVRAEYEMVAGLEDLGIGADGLIWSVSEAGSQRWHNWASYFPLVIAIDPRKLR